MVVLKIQVNVLFLKYANSAFLTHNFENMLEIDLWFC